MKKLTTYYVALFFTALLGESVLAYPPDVVPTNMVWISPGTFTMGSPETEPARWSNEGPQRQVTITRGFYMGKFEVTQAEYLSVMGTNPSAFTTEWEGHLVTLPSEYVLEQPVESVTWDDAVKYCAALTQRERLAGRLAEDSYYRLPTEAEWEYACRAGTTTPFYYGETLRSRMANFDGHYEYPPCPDFYPRGTAVYCKNPTGHLFNRTTQVSALKRPNAWGLYDMHGNVWEWCQDWYGLYPEWDETDPTGFPAGSVHVLRGGGWNNIAADLRSARRQDGLDPYTITPDAAGFRVVLAQAVAHEPFSVTLEVFYVYDFTGSTDVLIEYKIKKMIRLKIIGGASYNYTIESSANLIDWVTAGLIGKVRHDVGVQSIGPQTDRRIEFEGPAPTNDLFYRAVAR